MRFSHALCLTILGLHLVVSSAVAAPPKVDVIVGAQATALEKLAATEIATDLKKIYEAEVTISSTVPLSAENLIFVGAHPMTKEDVSRKWPNLKEQDHFLLTLSFNGKPALLVGGHSPAATYWAASEFAHSLGVRSFLFGDLYPVSPKPFSLDGYESLLSTNSDSGIVNGTWTESDPFPSGFTAWSVNDAKQRLRQLARLKYASVELTTHPSQPFAKAAENSNANVGDSSGVLWYGWQFPVSGDTAGRSAFRGAKFFVNPDFEGAADYKARMQAGKKWLTGLIGHAESLGVQLRVSSADVKSQAAFRPLVSDESLDAYRNSRNRFGDSLSSETACSNLIDPVFGEGVSVSIHRGIEHMRNATRLIEENDPQFSMPAPDMILRHYVKGSLTPEWQTKAKELFLNATNEMYRANTRAREGGRSFSLYLARRSEFGYEFMNCVETVRSAATAREMKDRAEQQTKLEQAIESIDTACSSLAAVARDPSDRGMIAIANQFGYRALQNELEKLEE